MSDFYDEYPLAGDVMTQAEILSLLANPNINLRVLELIANDELEISASNSEELIINRSSFLLEVEHNLFFHEACDYYLYNQVLARVIGKKFHSNLLYEYEEIIEDALGAEWTSVENLKLLVEGFLNNDNFSTFKPVQQLDYIRRISSRYDLNDEQREEVSLKEAELLLMVDWDV